MKIVETCIICGKRFSMWPSQAKAGRRACSRSCGNERKRTSNSPPIETRFWNNVDKNGPVPPRCPELGPCWLWVGSRDQKGYGNVSVHGSTKRAHRVSWTIANGKIPPGLQVLHKCDNQPCVNPRHLYVGTNQDNMDDKRERGRQVLPPAVLTETSVREIRRLRAAGHRCKDVAKRFGVSCGTISHVTARRNWKHVT